LRPPLRAAAPVFLPPPPAPPRVLDFDELFREPRAAPEPRARLLFAPPITPLLAPTRRLLGLPRPLRFAALDLVERDGFAEAPRRAVDDFLPRVAFPAPEDLEPAERFAPADLDPPAIDEEDFDLLLPKPAARFAAPAAREMARFASTTFFGLVAALPARAPITPPTTAPTGPPTLPTTAPAAAPACAFEIAGMFSFPLE